MKVLMVAAENGIIPGAKVGGIADVIRDIPVTLAKNNVKVDVIIPDHGLYHQKMTSELISTIQVSFRGELTDVSLYRIMGLEQSPLINQYVVYHESFIRNGSAVYSHDHDNRPFAIDANKFSLFCLAVCELLLAKKLAFADVIHLHDWHAAIINVLIAYDRKYHLLQSIRRVFTVHNIALQGIRPLKHDDSSLEAWFPNLAYQGEMICDRQYLHCFNPMRAGINLAVKIHLVSPTYSVEVLQASRPKHGFYGGEGLEQDLNAMQENNKLVGILNGCDYQHAELGLALAKDAHLNKVDKFNAFLLSAQQCLQQWVAQTTWLKSNHYLANERIKQWLTMDSELGLIMTSVGGLTEQKVRLLLDPFHQLASQSPSSVLVRQQALAVILTKLNNHNGRFIMIGSGEQELEQAMTILMQQHHNFLFLSGYNNELSGQLYQFGELFLMPSSFEPCGISQMLAMRAGQPCLVHQVGGLKDTVHHLESGFCFSGGTIDEQVEQLITCFNETLSMYNNAPQNYRQIAEIAQQRRFSWQSSIELYINKLYS